jgi:4-carboxymuconolactone decarboxylase
VPAFENADEEAVHAFARELLDNHFVQDATFQKTLSLLGQQAMVELAGLLGYYALVAMTLNAFQVPLPQGVEPGLPEAPVF